MTAPPQQIYRPPPFTINQRLSAIIHGAAKAGKTSLAATGPKPILVIDGEGSWRFIPGTVYWEPTTEPFPFWDGNLFYSVSGEIGDIVVVLADTWEVVENMRRYLRSAPNWPFVTVVIDSISEIQRRLKETINFASNDQRQAWGQMLDKMSTTLRGYRDLCMVRQIAVRCVLFISESTTGKSPSTHGTREILVPAMQGKVGELEQYWTDMIAYFYIDYVPDGYGNMQTVRRLSIGPHPSWMSGSRIQEILGYSVDINKSAPGTVGTDIEDMMRFAFQYRAPVQQQQYIQVPQPNGAPHQ